jgi:hypothetical protein
MQDTTKYQISQLPAAQEARLGVYTNNWWSIRRTRQKTHKLRRTKFIRMPDTTKYQISKLPAAQESKLKRYTNNWCSIRRTHQTTHKLRIT